VQHGWRGLAGAVALAAVLAAAPSADAEPATERISVNSAGVQANAPGSWWYLAPKVAFSADGNLVAFSSDATNLVRRDRNRASDVFVRDRARGITERVSLTASGREPNGLSFAPAMSADGRYVAFLSEARNLPGVRRKRPGRYVFLRDRVARTTVRVDVGSGGQGGRGGAWSAPVISADGRRVAFTTDAPNLVAGDEDTNADAFVRDLAAGTTTAVSLGRGANRDYEFSVAAAMSRDGRYVVVVSESRLTPEATGDSSHVYLRDLAQGTLTWLAPSHVDVFDARAAVSDDGSVVAFEGYLPASGLLAWTRAGGAVTCISCWNGVTPATWDTLSGMSADGSRIAYQRTDSPARGVYRSMFLHDRGTGLSTRISVGPGGVLAAGSAELGGLSPDGRYAAFASEAANLVPGDTNRRDDLFVRGPL
jgi:Tol biopolymer transport system component